MGAHFDLVQWQSRSQSVVHRGNHRRINQAVADIGLIRDNDHQKSGALQFGNRCTHTGQQPKSFQGAQCVGLPITHFTTGDYSVPVKKNGALQAA